MRSSYMCKWHCQELALRRMTPCLSVHELENAAPTRSESRHQSRNTENRPPKAESRNRNRGWSHFLSQPTSTMWSLPRALVSPEFAQNAISRASEGDRADNGEIDHGGFPHLQSCFQKPTYKQNSLFCLLVPIRVVFNFLFPL